MKRLTLSVLLIIIFVVTALYGETEIVSERTFFTKTFHVEANQYFRRVSPVPMHYRNESGEFVEIDPRASNRDELIQLAYEQRAQEAGRSIETFQVDGEEGLGAYCKDLTSGNSFWHQDNATAGIDYLYPDSQISKRAYCLLSGDNFYPKPDFWDSWDDVEINIGGTYHAPEGFEPSWQYFKVGCMEHGWWYANTAQERWEHFTEPEEYVTHIETLLRPFGDFPMYDQRTILVEDEDVLERLFYLADNGGSNQKVNFTVMISRDATINCYGDYQGYCDIQDFTIDMHYHATKRISGTVLDENEQGIPFCKVTAFNTNGTPLATVSTNSQSGYYWLDVNLDWSGTIEPWIDSDDNYEFTPESIDIPGTVQDMPSRNFVGRQQFLLSGDIAVASAQTWSNLYSTTLRFTRSGETQPNTSLTLAPGVNHFSQALPPGTYTVEVIRAWCFSRSYSGIAVAGNTDAGTLTITAMNPSLMPVTSTSQQNTFSSVQDALDMLMLMQYDPNLEDIEKYFIAVGPGTYDPFQICDFDGKNLKVHGTNNNTVIIEGENSYPGINIKSNVNCSITIEGLKVQDSEVSGVVIDRLELASETPSSNCEYRLYNMKIVNNAVYGFYPYDEEKDMSGAGVYSNYPVTISDCEITNNHGICEYGSYTYGWGVGGGIYVCSEVNGDTVVEDCVISGNSAREAGAIYFEGDGSLLIDNNEISENALVFPRTAGEGAGHSMGVHVVVCDELTVSNNVITDHERYFANGTWYRGYAMTVVNCDDYLVINNTIADNENLDGLRISYAYNGEILNNIFLNNKKPIKSTTSLIDVGYCCWYGNSESNYFGGGYTPDATNIAENPCLDTNNIPIWNSTTRSPVIDRGDPSITDHDNTTSDIGAKCAVTHKQEDYTFTQSSGGSQEIHWVCFPVTDDVYTADNEPEFFFVPLEYNMDGIMDNAVPATRDGPDWDYTGFEPVDPTRGYKVTMNSTTSMDKSGFLADPDTDISLANNSTTWVGYFLEESQRPTSALADVLDNLQQIQHHDWTLTYDPLWGWLGLSSYTLNYGDMVILTTRTTGGACEFAWSDNLIPEDPKMKKTTSYFACNEEPDYVPVYLDLSAYNENMPQEVGMYADGTLIGATVADSVETQINAYVDEIEDIENAEISFELYFGQRSPVEQCELYTVSSELTDGFVTTSKMFATKSRYYMVTLGEGGNGEPVPDLPETVSVRNYPNPFNPETTISYALPQDGQAVIKVYNLRGQLVKTLVNDTMEAGYHNVVWAGKDENNKSVASGIYFLRMQAGGKTLTHKLMLLK